MTERFSHRTLLTSIALVLCAQGALAQPAAAPTPEPATEPAPVSPPAEAEAPAPAPAEQPEPAATHPAPTSGGPSRPAVNPGLPKTDPNGDEVVPPASKDFIEAKFGKGVTFQAADGAFKLQLRGRIQPRFTSSIPEGGDAVNEFIIRRARLAFNGRFLDAWELYLQLGLSNQDNEADNYNPLRDATITYAGLRDVVVRAGQMKVPFDRQRMTSSSALEFADRSIVMSELTLDRDVGLQLFSEDLGGLGGVLGYNVGIFGGDGRNRRAENAGLMWVARVWTSPFGEFDPGVEADFDRAKKFRLALGAAAAQNFQSVRTRSTSAGTFENSTFDYTHLTADLTIKCRGLFWLTELLYRQADRPSNTVTVDGADVTEYSRSAWGFFTQAGYMWNKHLETSARYGELRPLDPTDPTLIGQREVGGAVSWYFLKHDLKVQADYFYLPTIDTGAATHQVRLQSQLYF
jgi:phosphate-selective porin OprO and OprP